MRALICCRMLLGLECISESRLQALRAAILEYERRCKVCQIPRYDTARSTAYKTQAITRKHGKSFKFIKQHHLSHVAYEDIPLAGVTGNSTTRPGEGFQQEVKEIYLLTNRRNVEKQVSQENDSKSLLRDEQMTNIDEDRELIAQIRMRCDEAKKQEADREQQARGGEKGSDDTTLLEADDLETGGELNAHWQLGSGSRSWRQISQFVESQYGAIYSELDMRLRAFIVAEYPQHATVAFESLEVSICPSNNTINLTHTDPRIQDASH